MNAGLGMAWSRAPFLARNLNTHALHSFRPGGALRLTYVSAGVPSVLSGAPVTEESDLPPKKREVPLSVQQARAARQVVSRFLPKVGPWQDRVAKLLAIAARHPGPEDRARLAAERQQLAEDVRLAMEELEAQIADAPDAVRRHSRVADARRAAGIVLGRLEELGAMLG